MSRCFFVCRPIFCAGAGPALAFGHAFGNVGQGHAVEIAVDGLVQAGPEGQGGALPGQGAFVDLALQAGDGGHAALHRRKDLASGGVGRVFHQAVAALAAPLALDKAGPRQGGDQLLEVFQAEVLPLADLLEGDGPAGALFGGGPQAIIIALAVMNWMGPARGYRGRILQFKNREFTLAAETLGATPMRIIYRHILPNILGNIVVSLTSFVPAAIFMEASLAFIGLGIAPPMTSLGTVMVPGAVGGWL